MMREKNTGDIKLAILSKKIDELREILNEICCSVDNVNNGAERLKISEQLDELIVEYMNQINKKG